MDGLTVCDAVEALRFAHEAVQLPHLADCDLVPAVLPDYALDLLAKECGIFRAAGEVVDGVSNALRYVHNELVFHRLLFTDTHVTGRVDGGEI